MLIPSGIPGPPNVRVFRVLCFDRWFVQPWALQQRRTERQGGGKRLGGSSTKDVGRGRGRTNWSGVCGSPEWARAFHGRPRVRASSRRARCRVGPVLPAQRVEGRGRGEAHRHGWLPRPPAPIRVRRRTHARGAPPPTRGRKQLTERPRSNKRQATRASVGAGRALARDRPSVGLPNVRLKSLHGRGWEGAGE